MLRLICLLAFVLSTSLVQAQSYDSPRLNKVEMQIVGMQVKIEENAEQVAKNTVEINNLKSASLGVVAPDPKPTSAPVVGSLPPCGVTYSTPVVTRTAQVIETAIPVTAPVVTYSSPVVTYSKPVVSYSRPKTTVTYSQPQPVVRYTKPVPVSRTRPTLRARLFGGSTSTRSCYIDANGNQVCPF